MAFVAALMMKVMLGRQIMIHRANASDNSRQIASAAERLVAACLDGNNAFGSTNCTLPNLAACGVPSSIGGHPITVTAAGNPPTCRIQIVVGD
jgi:hypothetical protein